jgi:glutathione S-transferase
VIALGQDDTAKNIQQYSPSGWIPVLVTPDTTVWDSLAICEHLAELFPEKSMWPKDSKARAWARSISSEMHSGFQTMRQNLPMKCHFIADQFDWSVAANDIQCIQHAWAECLTAYQHLGPYLFGQFSIADCMYAPVILRFRSYGIPLKDANFRYYNTMLNNPALQKWLQDASQETWRIQRYGD